MHAAHFMIFFWHTCWRERTARLHCWDLRSALAYIPVDLKRKGLNVRCRLLRHVSHRSMGRKEGWKICGKVPRAEVISEYTTNRHGISKSETCGGWISCCFLLSPRRLTCWQQRMPTKKGHLGFSQTMMMALDSSWLDLPVCRTRTSCPPSGGNGEFVRYMGNWYGILRYDPSLLAAVRVVFCFGLVPHNIV